MGNFDTATLLLIAAFVVGIAALWWIASQTSSPTAIEPRTDDSPTPNASPVAVPKPKPKAAPSPALVMPVDPVAETPLPATATDLNEIGIPAAVGAPDNLLLLKGVGPKLTTLLTGLGITRFDQIAAWGPAEIEAVDLHLGAFTGRIGRDNWIEQAGFLARGDIAAFETKFGKLDGPIA